jgi:hypothetical protein
VVVSHSVLNDVRSCDSDSEDDDYMTIIDR